MTDPTFLLPGTDCYCDSEGRCDNHDEDREADWWYAAFVSTPPAIAISLETERADGVYDERPHKYADAS